MIVDKESKKIVEKIEPIVNKCVIFNTCKDSLHGHPEKLNTPENIDRESLAMYYYTKNENGGVDFFFSLDLKLFFYSCENFF